MRYGEKWPQYAQQWNKMKPNASRVLEFQRDADFAVLNKDKYAEIEQGAGVPWWLVALLHRRESDADFKTYLGNGEPLDRKTRIVPKGRGPFASFFAGALDALHIDGLDAIKDWRLEKALYYCELFNGVGYSNRGLPSPYIWGGTNIQKPGKYIADGKWNGRAIDTQPGCAPILQAIMERDASVKPVRES